MFLIKLTNNQFIVKISCNVFKIKKIARKKKSRTTGPIENRVCRMLCLNFSPLLSEKSKAFRLFLGHVSPCHVAYEFLTGLVYT